MAGMDPVTGEPIYYPGETDSEARRIWHGSPVTGGGLASIVGPILIIVGFAAIVWGLVESDNKAPEQVPTTQIQQSGP